MLIIIGRGPPTYAVARYTILLYFKTFTQTDFATDLDLICCGAYLPITSQSWMDNMESILINLVAGALGGAGAGKASPNFDLGTIGNLVAGAVGGGVLGQFVTALLPAVTAAATSGNFSIGSIITHAIAGGAGGAILTALAGAVKNRMTQS